MNDFFKYETDFQGENGFEMFGTVHITWLFLIIVLCILLSTVYRKKSVVNDTNKNRFKYCIGVIMPVISIYRDIVLIMTGHFDKYYLPLHLCEMALWIGSLYCFTNCRFAGVLYVLLCVPGAMSALIFPDWTGYPFFNYMHIHDFVSHGLIVSWGICLITSGEIMPKWKELWIPVIFGFLGVVIIYPINMALGTNYWFLSYPSPGSPLIFISNLMGEKWYVTGFIILVVIIIMIWMCIIKGINSVFFHHKR